MKRKKKDLTEIEYIKTLDMLYTAAASVKGRDAVKQFLKDLLTHSERIMLGRRIWIARLLMQGVPYEVIAQKLRVGMGTIHRVDRWLHDQFPGFEKAIHGLEEEFDRRARKKEARTNPFSYAALKRKYPLHFLLFPDPKPKKQFRE
jgi:uncharacterized protein YerC